MRPLDYIIRVLLYIPAAFSGYLGITWGLSLLEYLAILSLFSVSVLATSYHSEMLR